MQVGSVEAIDEGLRHADQAACARHAEATGEEEGQGEGAELELPGRVHGGSDDAVDPPGGGGEAGEAGGLGGEQEVVGP